MLQDTLIGRQINDFIIQERLSRGARATVYRAYQPAANRDVALKVIRMDARLSRDEEFIHNYNTEIGRLADLSHINILPIYDYGVGDEVAYIAMRLTRSRTLDNVLLADALPDLTQATHIVTQIGRALAYANRKNLVHYDLKPENILIDDANNAYLSDFGIPRYLMGDDMIGSRDSTAILSPLYLSPEQLRTEPVTAQSNVFSLGMLLYHLTVGRLPYDTASLNRTGLLLKHMTSTPAPPRELNPDVPLVVNDVVMRALAINPEHRYANTDDMVTELNQQLRNLFERVEIPAERDIQLARLRAQAAEERQRQSSSRLPYVIFSMVATLLIFIVGGIVVYMRELSPVPIILSGEQIAAADLEVDDSVARRADRQLERGRFVGYYTCDDALNDRSDDIQSSARRYGQLVRIYRTTAPFVPPPQQSVAEGAATIIYCNPPESILPQLERIAQDIPVIIEEETRPIAVPDSVLVTSSEQARGIEAGRAAAAYIENDPRYRGGTSVLLFGLPPDTPDRALEDGLREGLTELSPGSNVIDVRTAARVVDVRNTLGTLLDDEIITFDVILTTTDTATYGVIQELESRGFVSSEIVVYTTGSELLARRFLAEDSILQGVAVNDGAATAEALFDATLLLLGGGVIPEQIVVDEARVLRFGDVADD
ncbi:MAG: bifunctional serine/threonine-protein kinase/ABC transporter substrate-binding protein [Chloroflexota bacterium]